MTEASHEVDKYLQNSDWVPFGQGLRFLAEKDFPLRSWHDSALIDDLPSIDAILSKHGKEHLDKLLLALANGQIEAVGMLSACSSLQESPFPHVPDQSRSVWIELLNNLNLSPDLIKEDRRTIKIPNGCWANTSIAKHECGKLAGCILGYPPSEGLEVDVVISEICISRRKLEEFAKTPKQRDPNDIETTLPRTIARMLYGMAVKHYGYDTEAPRSPVPGKIKHDLESLGIPVDEKTIREKLRQAAVKVKRP